MKTFKFAILLLITFTFQANAALITWTGGNSNWDNPANWSTGTIPTNADNVVIGSGPVIIPNGYAAEIATINIGINGILELKNNSSLTIQNVMAIPFVSIGDIINNGTISISAISHAIINIEGITNNGSFLNKADGTIILTDIDNSGISNGNIASFENRGLITISLTGTGDGISNYGSFVNKSNGIININESGDDGIYNDAQGTFQNDGTISVDGLTNQGVLNEGIFINNNALAITNAGDIALQNEDSLMNTGTLTIDVFVSKGLYNGLSAVMSNSGLLFISNGTGIFNIGLVNNGKFVNKLNGAINIENVLANGLLNSNISVEFKNKGQISIDQTGDFGLSNAGTFTNSSNGEIIVDNSFNFGLHTTDQFYNFGKILLESGNIAGSMDNSGDFRNENCGELIVHGAVVNLSGNFINKGWMVNNYAGSHANAGTMKNKWVLEDLYEGFAGLIQNKKVIIRPIAGPLTVGIPTPDALQLHNDTLGAVIVIGWFTDETLATSAGSYDGLSNEFTPSVDAVGLSRLYIQFEQPSGSGSCFYSMKIDITGGIQNPPPGPLQNQGNDPIAFNALSLNDDTNKNILLYPNPVTNELNIQSFRDNGAIAMINLLQSNGQKIASYRVAEQAYFNIQIPEHLQNGIYFVQLVYKNGDISIAPVSVNR